MSGDVILLKITTGQLSGLSNAKLQKLGPRVDAWLADAWPEWRRYAPDARLAELREILALAASSGMAMETDYALFAWVLLNSDTPWRTLVRRGSVAEALDAPDWAPQSKLVHLHALAGAPEFPEPVA